MSEQEKQVPPAPRPAAPLSEKEKFKRENGHKLWTVEVIFINPEGFSEAEVKRYEYKNLLHSEFRELRSSLFSEGLLYALDPVRWCVAPPGNIKNIYAFKQRKFLD